MTWSRTVPAVGAVVLVVGAVTMGGTLALALAAAGMLATAVLVLKPTWPPGPGLVGAALVGQVATAPYPSWRSTAVGAVLLLIFLAVADSMLVAGGGTTRAVARRHVPAAAWAVVEFTAVALTVSVLHFSSALMTVMMLGLGAGAAVALLVWAGTRAD